jgi:hypothetical protein
MSDDAAIWFTARKGAQLAYWKPEGLLLGVIEVHPDHPPIMHWIGGADEELKVSADGTPIVDVPNPLAPITVTIGKPSDELRDPTIWDFQIVEPYNR